MGRKRLVYWCKPQSDEEKSINEIANEIDSDPRKIALALDDVFSFFREALTDETMPDVLLGDLFKIYASPFRLKEGIARNIMMYRYGLIPRGFLDYRLAKLIPIRKRIREYERLSSDDKHEQTALWRSTKGESLVACIKTAKEAHKESGERSFYVNDEKRQRFLRAWNNRKWTDIERARLFGRWRIQEAIKKQEEIKKKGIKNPR